jgi:hypothetical protein
VASTILNSNSANNYGTVTISSTSSYFSTGSVTIPSSYYVTNGGSVSNWSSNITTTAGTNTPSLHVTGEAEFENDIKIKGVSLAKMLEDINNRLAILVPDPAKLEHFEALQKAYEHYKLLEALCQLPKKESE